MSKKHHQCKFHLCYYKWLIFRILSLFRCLNFETMGLYLLDAVIPITCFILVCLFDH